MSEVSRPTKLIAGLLAGHSLAILTTFVRLGHRLHRRQLWWDDFWAFIALALTLVTAIITGLNTFSTKPFPERAASFLLWGNFWFQPGVIWASRLSMQATIVRFLPPGTNRRVSEYSFIAFVVMWVGSSISKIFYCGVPVPLYPFCPWSNVPTVISLILNLIATVWLVAWPAVLVLHMDLSRPRRRLFIVCFSSASVLGITNTIHGANLMLYYFEGTVITGQLEVMVSLVSCNVLVLATYIYRVFRPSDDESSSSSNSESSISNSKRENLTHSNLPPTSQRIDTQASSSVGPLTTVYSTVGPFSQPRSSAGESRYSQQVDPRTTFDRLSSLHDTESKRHSFGAETPPVRSCNCSHSCDDRFRAPVTS